jgi:enoyl-CoA hydratase
MSNKNESILLVERKSNIIYLILNRQSVLNSLNERLLLELKRELEKVKLNSEIHAIVITGAGDKSFSAGADIQYLAQASPLQIRRLANLAVTVNNLIENLGKISIALINGFALGGGLELAESCMFRIAVSSAKLGHPEVKIGAVAGWGGTTRLPRLIGKSRAAEMLLTGKMIDANEAVKIGLINRVTEQKKMQQDGENFLQEILKNSIVATNLSWDALHRGLNMSSEESAKLGADYFGLVATTEEFRNGIRMFLSRK